MKIIQYRQESGNAPIKLTDEVKRLNQNSELFSERTIAIDKRVVRLETIIEIAEKQAYLPKE